MVAKRIQRLLAPFVLRFGIAVRAWLYCLVLLCPTPNVLAEEVVVTVPRSSKPVAPVSRHALAAIFGMRLTTWPDGTAIKVVVLPDDDPIHAAFCKQVLHVFPHQMRTAWDRLVYSGTGQAPETLNSQKEMRARIASTPGAIGYLTKDMIDDTVTILPVE